MHTLIARTISLLCCAALFGCSPAVQDANNGNQGVTEVPTRVNAKGYPDGFEGWPKLNPKPIVRKDSAEVRELYRNGVAAAPGADGKYKKGAILVKAQHRLVGGKKGRLFQLSVMTKTGRGDYSGWEFATFDPNTGQRKPGDADVCAICHSQRAANDYVFGM